MALLPGCTDAPWLHDYVFPSAAALCYWRGRLRCTGEHSRHVAPRMVAYWGERPLRFRDAFTSAGAVVFGEHVDRAPSWTLIVPRPSPVATWIDCKGAGSLAVQSFRERFANDLDLSNAIIHCPPATGHRTVMITRHGNRVTHPVSLERGGQLVVAILRDKGLLSEHHGYDVQWRQAIDRRRPRTEIHISDDPPLLA